jgi:hypothetical protein
MTSLNLNYNQQWYNIAKAHGCSDGVGLNACWEDLVVNAFHAMWHQAVLTLHDQNLTLWIQNTAFPSIAGCDANPPTCGGLFDTQPKPPAQGGEIAQSGINNRIFAYANANQPANGQYYVTYEAQGANSAWANQVPPWFNGTVTPAATGGASQMVTALYKSTLPNPATCPNLCHAGALCGAYYGDFAPQIYGSDFTNCDHPAFDQINNAINGATNIVCSDGTSSC